MAEALDSSNAIQRRNAWILLALTAALWAGQSIAGKTVTQHLTPGVLSLVRWLVILLVMAPIAWRELRREHASVRANWRILLALAVLGTTLQNSIFLWGLRHSSAVNAALLNSTIPIWILVISALLFGRRSARGEWIGVAISIAGVVMIVLGGSRAADGSLAFNIGDLIMASGMVTWSLYSVLVPRRPLHLSPWGFLAVLALIGVVIGIPPALIEIALGFPQQFNASVVWGLAYMIFPGAILVTVTYNFALDKLGPAKAGFGIHLVPVWGMVLAFMLLGETTTWVAFGGFLLVLAGIAIGQTARR